MGKTKDALEKSWAEFEVQGPLTDRRRPATGGLSIGQSQSTGRFTLGCLVRDRANKDATYILSAITPAEAKKKGDPLLQPAITDGGQLPEDTIATLERWIVIVASSQSWEKDNLDVAIWRVTNPADVIPEIEGVGQLAGVADAEEGSEVLKVGSTTGLTNGHVLDTHFRFSINRGEKRYGYAETILCSKMSSGGDRGAILIGPERRAVGILFAGSENATVFFPMRRVLDALGVDLLMA